MFFKTLIPATLLTLVSATALPNDSGMADVIDGEFEIQPYELPGDQGYRHMTSIIDENNKEWIAFGGLGNGGPSPPTPMNHHVFTLDLTRSPSEQEWTIRNTDAVVTAPWFTSTRGFIEIDGKYYLTCDDADQNAVYSFNADTYQFEFVSTSSLAPEINAGDCCAVGVKIPNNRNDHDKDEERIYIIGGRNNFASPVKHVRYYSITHDRWEQVADLNIGRSHLGCISTEQKGEPRIYVIGGGNSPLGLALRSIEKYDVIDDKWTLYPDRLSEGRTRLGVQNIDNKYLLLIGGDSSCAGGGPNNSCAPDNPLNTVDLIDIQRGGVEVFSASDYSIPQLKSPRQTPATSLRKRMGNNQTPRYVLYVLGGRTRDPQGALGVLTTAEVLRFDGIHVAALQK